jgi:hypothetical protein
MSLDASNLLDSLTLIEYHKVTGRCLVVMELLERGYTKITTYLMGDTGRSMIQAVMIFINSLRGSTNSRKRESNYLGPKYNRKHEPPNYFISHLIGGN